MSRTALWVTAFLVVCFVVAGAAAGATKEDLSACKLPNGLIVMPERDSPGAEEAGGYIFSFTSLRFARIPSDIKGGRPGAVAELFDRMRKEKAGDLVYSSLEGGGLAAISGKISDLGEHYLYSGSRRSGPSSAQRTSATWSCPAAMSGSSSSPSRP